MNSGLPGRKKRASLILKELKELNLKTATVLRYADPWELLVAVMLSAQCTDKKVNEVTSTLFTKYKGVASYAKADLREFEQDIRSTGFYKSKAKNVLGASRMIQERFGGKVPCSMEELLELPGVARKTANIVLGLACGKIEGIPVDTHVKRFALRLGLTDNKDPVKIERDLMELFPRKEWLNVTFRLIEYGRNICPARPHECSLHPLTRIYPKAAAVWPKAKR